MTDNSPQNGNTLNAKNQEKNKKRKWLRLNQTCKIFFIVMIFVVIIAAIYFFQNFSKPKLVVPRYNHSAVVLQDGQILITGGETFINGKSVKLNSSEIYNPKTKKCISVNNKMNYERSNHSSVLLPNGNVLIIGGGSQIPEIFNAVSKTFYKLPVSSNIKDIAIAEKINDKKIIIVSPSNNIIEEFDLENNKFKKIGVLDSLNTNIRHILNYNGILFFPTESFNQSDLSAEPKEKVVISYYDYKKNIIGAITKPQSIFDFCIGNMISEVNNELIHFCSKNTLYSEIYDFKTNKFIKKSLTTIHPKAKYITAKYNDVIILAGGYKIPGPLGRPISIGVYDSKTNEIYEKKLNKIFGINNYSSVQTDKEIIIIGGLTGASTVTDEIQIIDIEKILK